MMEEFIEENYPWRNPQVLSKYYNTYFDKFPVTDGHVLFVPVVNSETCVKEAFAAAYRAGLRMVADGYCDDFNVGFNSGPAAGQTVKWPHVHLIPRREGDVDDPTGGIRGVIPSKQNYKTSKDYI